MPPASANNNANNAALQAAKAERAEKLRRALKGFVVEQRQRRQEEYEAKCEELRLRREREARDRENTLTLEDTRNQISRLEEQLSDLHSQKHQLMVQLKKVLNEDETRKKQIKENEIFASQPAMQQIAVNIAKTHGYLSNVRLQHNGPPGMINMQHAAVAAAAAGGGHFSTKRGRSPSPPNQHPAYFKSYAPPKHDDRAADYARYSWNKSSAQYPNAGTLFYQTTAAPPTTQHSIYNYGLPLRPSYHVELQPGPGKAPDGHKAQPMQVLHINLDQPPISQSDLVVPTSKPQVTMEKLNDRYHIEVKHDVQTGPPPPPPHLLSEGGGVIFKPLHGELSLQPNVLQISSSQNPKSTGSITQGYAPGRGGTIHDQQIARQQLQMLSAGQAGAPQPPPTGQQMHYARRLY